MEKIPVFSFLTLGCRLNQAEEEKLRREVFESGFFVSEPLEADFCIVNSCSVTTVADRKTRQAIKKLKSQNSKLKIVVTGCGAEMAKEYPEVDFIVLNENKECVIKKIQERYSIVAKRGVLRQGKRTRALLKIQDGCNNFCAYCIVPYLRGREVSLGAEEVIKEAQKLDGMGYRELVLSGVNVGKYSCELSGERIDLTKLIKEILIKTNFPRIRLSSINPQDVTDEMIILWENEPRLAHHFHLSLQSGSNFVLKKMGRPYTTEQYLKLSKKIVQKLPDAALTTDVIVGFPGETDADFEDTIELVRAVEFAKLHLFRYSPRNGTRAAEMEGQISESIKEERAKKLSKIGRELEEKFKKRFIGKEIQVLFEEEKDGKWVGLTTNYIRIKMKSKDCLTNQMLKVKINEDNVF